MGRKNLKHVVVAQSKPRAPAKLRDPGYHQEWLRRPHPHQYPPYLYEGYTRAQRPFRSAATWPQ